MNKWVWVAGGTAAVIVLGFVFYQTLFGNNDEALEVKKQVPPVVQKAKVNKQTYEIVNYIPNNGGGRNPMIDGKYRFQLEPPKSGETILNVPAKLLEIFPVLGQKLWVTFQVDNQTVNHKATAISVTPPLEVPAGQVVLMGEYVGITLQPSDKKRHYRLKYGTFDEAKQSISDVLTYKAKNEEIPAEECESKQSETDVCVLKRFNKLEFTITVNEFGEATLKQLVKAPDAVPFTELFKDLKFKADE